MTKIEWVRNADGSAGESWNPIVGCSIATPGCTNCYAQRTAWRLANNPATPHYAGTVELVKGKPIWTGKVARAPDRVMTEPLRRRKPTTYFVNSMGDLFHEDVPDEWIDQISAVMALTPQHTYQILTKRADRQRDYCQSRNGMGDARLCRAINEIPAQLGNRKGALSMPLPNVWRGVSAERQREWDERKEHLRQTPAAVRFASFEPLLGPIDGIPDWLDWVIAGGESGPGARPMHPDWARGIRDQCQAAGVPFFFKQWGEWAPGECAVANPTRTEETATWWNDRWDFGRITLRESEELHGDDAPDLYRFGKARTHRTLDGRTWDEMPAAPDAAK